MFERFTKPARRVVLDGLEVAAELGADKVRPPHLLLALVSGEGAGGRVLAGYGVTAAVLRGAEGQSSRRAGLTDEEVAALRSVGIDAEEVFRRVEEAFGPDALADAEPAPRPRRRLGRLGGPFDPAAKKVLELSLREAIALRHRHLGTEHILLALLRAGVPGPMGQALAAREVTYEDAKRRVLEDLRRAA
ncbi:MAG TPA: Clp protease N-terminal domain-containing protein [Micromonosporaceae bacterium]|nr:Clp protease N-terminal domain-containing protein [Micromonosporaceae bacterium]